MVLATVGNVKVTAPNFWYCAGVLQILFVQGFNVSGVLSTKVRAAQHALHESFSHRIPLSFTGEHVLTDVLFGLLLALFIRTYSLGSYSRACALRVVSML